MTLRALVAFLATILITQFADAGTSGYGSMSHNERLPKVLFLLGQIKSGDSFELRRAMRDYEIELLVTASPGGNLYEGLQIASIVHDKGVSTYIPEGASCESSCANIFLGGQHRLVLGEVGVHQFYPSGDNAETQSRNDVTTSATQYTTSEIIGIMNEFGTPPFVYEKMFGTDEIYYFRGAEKQKLSRGGDDEEFLDLLSEVDDFLALNANALIRPTTEPEPSITANMPAKPGVPNTTPKLGLPHRFADIDFFGMDLNYKGIRNVSVNQCEQICHSNTRCAAYTYVTEARWCWPKSRVQNVSIANGVVSGIIDYSRVNRAAFERPFVEATAIDLPGYDIYPRGLKNMSLNQCRYACQATSGCAAFSWVAKKSWCFPKHGVGQVTDSIGIISGIKN